MGKYELDKLTRKFLNGTATDEEKQMLHDWYDSTLAHDNAEYVNTREPESDWEVKQRIYNSLQNKIEAANSSPAKKVKSNIERLLTAAASIAAMLLIGFAIGNKANKLTIDNKQLAVAAKSKVRLLVFADGSKAWLNAGSILIYPSKFNGKLRTVELVEGRAFFDIKHMVGHPFIVKTKNLSVTVLGTSFDVRSYRKEGTTKVSVVTGKVGITRPNHPRSPAIMLVARQQIVLNAATDHVVKEPVREAVVNLWCKEPLVFDQENLNNVFKALEKKYDTKIIVADKELLTERISITLGNQRLDTIMEILSFTKHFNYKMANDSTVVIK